MNSRNLKIYIIQRNSFWLNRFWFKKWSFSVFKTSHLIWSKFIDVTLLGHLWNLEGLCEVSNSSGQLHSWPTQLKKWVWVPLLWIQILLFPPLQKDQGRTLTEHGHPLEGGCCHQSHVFSQLSIAPVLAGVTQSYLISFNTLLFPALVLKRWHLQRIEGWFCILPRFFHPPAGPQYQSGSRAFTPWLLSTSWA